MSCPARWWPARGKPWTKRVMCGYCWRYDFISRKLRLSYSGGEGGRGHSDFQAVPHRLWWGLSQARNRAVPEDEATRSRLWARTGRGTELSGQPRRCRGEAWVSHGVAGPVFSSVRWAWAGHRALCWGKAGSRTALDSRACPSGVTEGFP